ncbi:MATE family efflux protein [Halarcobacter anaerophilus]|nr:MATE family efflux protein [Halarcobacter anaerophilus]
MQQNYKRIAKNTLFLYFRMLIIMAVNFYTVRVVLDVLGVTDYGIYNLVASFVMILAFLNSTLTSGTQRFLTFELGKEDFVKLKHTFSTAVIIHFILAIIILIFGETIGLWFLYEKMNIPIERFDAAFWAYQFAIFSTMITVMQVPYNALIIAHERMHIFAYISIVEAILKLLVVYLLLIVSTDKLISYAIFMFITSILIASFYRIYTIKNYKESHFEFVFDKKIMKSMMQFSGWNLFGSIAWILMNYGINVLLSIFFSPAIVASRAISMQVNTAIFSLVGNFRTAVNPQIIKMFSSENNNEMKKISLISARYTFYLALILVLPIYFEIDTLLGIWLVDIPLWTIEFCKLILIFSLIQTFDMSFGILFQAIGKMKENQILSGGVYLLVLPLSYILFSFYNLDPRIVFYVQIAAVIIVSFVVKIILLNKIANIRYSEYLYRIILPIIKVIFSVVILVFFVHLLKLNFILNIFSIIFIVLLSIFVFDFTKDMKYKTLDMLKIKIKQYRR